MITMREVGDKGIAQTALRAKVVGGNKESGANAHRNLHRQEAQIPLPAAHDGNRSEAIMPMRAPMGYSHWGLNE